MKLKIIILLTVQIFILNSFAQVYVNQSGYIKNYAKIFYTSSVADSFKIIDNTNGQIYYTGDFNLFVTNDPATGLTLYKGDFSDFNRTGEYYIKTSSGDSSYNFKISTDAFKDVYYKSLKGFYFQRCGMTLEHTYAGVYYHPICHNSDGTFHTTTGRTGTKNTTKGWHDAGDYGKYIVNAGISAGSLLLAYETFPGMFNQDDLNIPESGNGIPDILDEVRYELDWFFKMQDTSGGVFFKVTKTNFESFIMPHNDSGIRYIYQISSTATADFAAVMARAARIFLQYDSVYAGQCKDAAIQAWEFLVANPSIVPIGGFKNPTGTYTGEYGDGNDSDERLWAAAELFETTGEATYKSYFESRYSQSGIFNSTMNWGNVKPFALLTYLNCTQSIISSTVKNNIRNSLISYCVTLNSRANANGFNITINPGEYNWGCNSDVLNKAIILLFGFKETGVANYESVALSQLNYILGTNAHNLSFITGIGTNSVMHPHHRPSASDGIVDPVPGLIAGGPNQYLNDPLLQSLFNSSTPPALCYVDHVDSYASNEICINWNAPLVFVAGYFNAKALTSVDDFGENNLNNFRIEQNYPNPFNPETKINFYVPYDSFVTLKVYDVLGKEITTMLNQDTRAGEYSMNFNGNQLASGVYLYQIKSEKYLETKKMVLLK